MDRPYFYLGKGRGLTRLSTGEVFFVDTESVDVGVWIMLGGVWETFVDDILCALVRPGDVCLDVGANLGYYSVKLAMRTGPEGHLYSFEPNPKMFRFVSDNIRINGLAERATLVNAAAGAAAGTSTLTFVPEAPGGGMVGLPPEMTGEGAERINVPVVRIDDVVPADAAVHLIKIDVEGFEPLVMAGMQAVLARSPDAAIVIEVSYAHWAQHGDPAEMIRGLAGQRRIFRIHTHGGIEELEAAAVDAALNRTFVSYMLLLPPTEDRWGQVSRFAGQPDGGPPPVPPAPSLAQRILRRAKTSIAFRLGLSRPSAR